MEFGAALSIGMFRSPEVNDDGTDFLGNLDCRLFAGVEFVSDFH